MTITPPSRRHRRSEDGYVLVAVIFMMVILILSLSVAIPKVREDIQRDRDEETMQRGKQYIRAVQLYYRKFNAYPPNVDALVKTNDIRFLRKKYIDPTTGKDEWKPIMWGQNKTPMVMGFFGQPLAAAVGGGIGPGGTGVGGIGGGGVGAGGVGGGTPGGGLFNSNPTGSTDSGTAGPTAPTGTGGTDANGNPVTGTGGGTGTTGTTGTSGSGGSAFGSSSNPAGTGQTFGGAGIIGFSPQSPKQSILVYKKKNHYNQWEFLYSPQMDQQQMASGTGLTGQAPSGGPNPTTPAPTPITPPTTTPPQQ
jgi:type II secretory pathway pseudopilin PulG